MTHHHIAIVDDHPLFRDALKQTLAAGFDHLKLSEAGSLEELSTILSGGEVDLVLLDLAMPGVQGFSGLIYLRSVNPEIPVVVVSANESPAIIRRCMGFGASGYIPKSLPIASIREAIATVLRGELWTPPGANDYSDDDTDMAALAERLSTLTPQQVRVLMMLGEGLLNKQIAYQLNVSEATVKAHVSAILQKLHVESRTQAVIAVKKIEAGEFSGFNGDLMDAQK